MDITVVPKRAVKARVLRARFSTLRSEREKGREEDRRGERALISFHFLPGKKKMPLTQIMPPKARVKMYGWREVA